MKKIIEWWWADDNKVFQITNYKKAWKELGNKPFFIYCHNNGGRRRNGDKCFDISLHIGYTIINYCNFDLQRTRKKVKTNE